jgi:integrase
MNPMLSLYRRHVKKCAFRKRTETKCQCPVWCDGFVAGVRVHQTMDTRNWSVAGRKLADLETEMNGGRVRKPVVDALAEYIGSRSLESATKTKYDRWQKFITAFAAHHELATVDQFSLAHLDEYRGQRNVGELTWSKELQFLRGFFGYAAKRGWCEDNPAKEADMPREPKPGDRVPYTPDEVAAILQACDRFGRGSYERRRARALVLLGRKYGFRISDASLLRRDAVADGRILVRAKKNGETLWAHVYPEVQQALDALPVPRHSDGREYFFWAGPQSSTPENFVKTTERTMQAVFRRSGVKGAHFHRFRHTLATELLTAGASVEDVANILGDDPATVRKYYLKWSPAYQARTAALLDAVHSRKPATYLLHEEIPVISGVFSVDSVVAKVGVEPTR